MKKFTLAVVALVICLSVIGCGKQKVMVQCDGEDCENMVEVVEKDGVKVDESWVVYCKTCADELLED